MKERKKEGKKERKKERMVVARGWGEGRTGSYCFMDTEFPFCKMKRVLQVDAGDDCTTL